MFNYDHKDSDYYDDDERFYEETAFNEEYYVEQEQQFVRQSNLEIQILEREEEYFQETREGRLPVRLQPVALPPSERTSPARQPGANPAS